MKQIVLTAILVAACITAQPAIAERFHWSGIDRIVAIGDIHGDWGHYLETLRAAGLVDDRNRWSGGAAHLVQTGDIADRGPDTRRIIEHMMKLSRQAERQGGRVHHLIGNHEAMNVYGDLRYVDEGEFTAFRTRRSEALLDRYYRALMDNLEQQDPERFEALPDDLREHWDAQHPPGWIEHRQAWSPAWGVDGEMFEWVMEAQIAVQLNDTLFVHGGLSGFYCQESLESLSQRAREELRAGDEEALDMVVDPLGPLWYRGLSGGEPAATEAAVEALLERHAASRIAVGHSPTGGLIWPRYDMRVVQIDTGISSAYGGNVGYLEITEDGVFAGYRNGRVQLPGPGDALDDYIREVIALHPDNESLKRRAAELKADAIELEQATDDADEEIPEAADEPEVPTCGTLL